MATSSVGFVEIDKLKVPELRKLCKEHGLTSTGKKEELVNRLKDALQEADDNILEESGEGDLVPESTVADDVNEDILNEEPVALKPKPPAVKQPVKHAAAEKENGQPPKKMIKISTVSAPATSPPTSPTKIASSPKLLTDEQRLALRAQKFGLNSEEARKAARSERFGTAKPTSGTGATKLSTAGTAVDVEKLKQRAERFGTITSKALASADVDAKLEKRKERFGTVSADQDDKLKKRHERFGVVTTSPSAAAGVKGTNLAQEEAKRKRAERFGLNK